MSVDTLSVTLRALGFLMLFQAAGIALFLALHQHQLRATGPALRALGVLAALIAAMLLIAQYALEAARMSGELGGMLDATLQGLVLRSATSVTLSWRLLGLALIAWGVRRGGAGGTTAATSGVVILLAAFAFVGHTSNDARRWVLGPVLIAHLFAVTFWFGALLPLCLVSSREPPELRARVIEQFSARAIWLVPGVALAGVLLATLLLPNLAALRRPYGELLIVKALGFSALMLLAALNRWRFAPALRRDDATSERRFRYTVAAEYALIAALFCVTAVLTTFYSPEG
jgi:putative copper resistance protein D